MAVPVEKIRVHSGFDFVRISNLFPTRALCVPSSTTSTQLKNDTMRVRSFSSITVLIETKFISRLPMSRKNVPNVASYNRSEQRP